MTVKESVETVGDQRKIASVQRLVKAVGHQTAVVQFLVKTVGEH